jgi:hypothetical protein
MKKFLNKIPALPAVIFLMALCMSMTSPIESSSIMDESSEASDNFSLFFVSESWTWSNFAGSAVVGGVGGAVGGAAAGALACGIGAGPGALAGGVGGAVGGAAGYAAQQAWSYFFGTSAAQDANQLAYAEAALD